MTDRGRETVLLDRIVCRACMAREVEYRRGERTETVPLFGAD